jgi:hypothetical protein
MTLTLDQILKYCNFLINKSQNADSISPDEFSIVLPIVNQEVFNKELLKVMQSYGQPGFIDAYKNSYLREVEVIYSATLPSPKATDVALPADYEMFISGKVMVGGVWEKLNLINSIDAYDSVEGVSGANDENSLAWLVGTSLHFNSQVSKIEMVYVERPLNPYYDYCIYMNEALYLPVGSTVSYNAGTYAATINGKTYTNVSPGYQTWSTTTTYTSVSSEFVWSDKLLTSITNLIFEKLSVNIREQLPIEISQMKKKEQ